MSMNNRLNGYYNTEVQLANHLRKHAESLLTEGRAHKARIDTKDKFLAYQERVRREYIENIGGSADQRTPLNTHITGEVRCDGFSIRKLYFESLPGYYVTANLYVPDGLTQKTPAVLFVSGHVEAGKADKQYQYACRDLVRNGFVVLSMDPMSQGERCQNYHQEIGRPVMRWYCEHTYYGVPCDWAGSSVIRYFLWDMVRALDQLAELPEVDAQRIGVTGNSGGGFQSALLMMCDDRLAAGMPVTFIKSADDYMRTGQAQDGEMFWPRQLAMHMNDDDYLTAFAPKPACIGAVESDFFCVEGVLECYESAKRMYTLAGAPDNLELALVPGLHDYNTLLRQAAVRFFSKHLMGKDSDFVAQADQECLDPAELWATPKGQVSCLAGFKPVWKQNMDYMAGELPPAPKDLAELRARLSNVLRMPEGVDAPIHMRYLTDNTSVRTSKNSWLAYRSREVFFLSEPDIALGAVLISVPGRSANRSAIMVMEDGALSYDWECYLVESIVTRGVDILVIDPRGSGMVMQRSVTSRGDYEMHGTEHKMGCDAEMCGLSLTGMRVFDILRGVKYLSETYAEFELVGRGIGALWATLAAPFVSNLKALHREDPPDSFRAMASAAYYHYDPRLKLFGILRAADTPEILELLQAEGVRVTEFTRPDHGSTSKW